MLAWYTSSRPICEYVPKVNWCAIFFQMVTHIPILVSKKIPSRALHMLCYLASKKSITHIQLNLKKTSLTYMHLAVRFQISRNNGLKNLLKEEVHMPPMSCRVLN